MMRTRGAKKKSKHDVERIKSIQKKIEGGSHMNENFTLFTQYRSIVNMSLVLGGKDRQSELVSFVIYCFTVFLASSF